MTLSLAQVCSVAQGCASIHPASAAEKAVVAVTLVVVFVLALAATLLTLDEPERRHATLHRLVRSKSCGRCIDDLHARQDDRAFLKSRSHSNVRIEIESPTEARGALQ